MIRNPGAHLNQAVDWPGFGRGMLSALEFAVLILPTSVLDGFKNKAVIKEGRPKKRILKGHPRKMILFDEWRHEVL
jgi:hypothetical protein